MAKGFKHGAGGGGTALNFKVVGNPQPESAKGNTIWVNTDVPIGAWYFAATQPENLIEGRVVLCRHNQSRGIQCPEKERHSSLSVESTSVYQWCMGGRYCYDLSGRCMGQNVGW